MPSTPHAGWNEPVRRDRVVRAVRIRRLGVQSRVDQDLGGGRRGRLRSSSVESDGDVGYREAWKELLSRRVVCGALE